MKIYLCEQAKCVCCINVKQGVTDTSSASILTNISHYHRHHYQD